MKEPAALVFENSGVIADGWRTLAEFHSLNKHRVNKEEIGACTKRLKSISGAIARLKTPESGALLQQISAALAEAEPNWSLVELNKRLAEISAAITRDPTSATAFSAELNFIMSIATSSELRSIGDKASEILRSIKADLSIALGGVVKTSATTAVGALAAARPNAQAETASVLETKIT